MLLLIAVAALAVAVSACGDGGSADDGESVIIEPLASATPAVAQRGKPAVEPTPTEAPFVAQAATPADTATEPPPVPAATEPPASAPTATQTAAPPPAPTATPRPPAPPESGRWIDVDVTNYVVRLMDGPAIVQEIGPVGVGAQVDTGAYLSTQTGLFYVNSKDQRLVYDAPYDTYISHWVGFDADKDNGFHSFLKDAAGSVVDASTGRVSNGCIRTGAPEAIFAFAEIGMPVWVHW